MADQGVNPVATILAAIATSQREMRELREELRAAQEEAAEKGAKRKEKPYAFQKKAHEEQSGFNEGIDDHLEQAAS